MEEAHGACAGNNHVQLSCITTKFHQKGRFFLSLLQFSGSYSVEILESFQVLLGVFLIRLIVLIAKTFCHLCSFHVCHHVWTLETTNQHFPSQILDGSQLVSCGFVVSVKKAPCNGFIIRCVFTPQNSQIPFNFWLGLELVFHNWTDIRIEQSALSVTFAQFFPYFFPS